MRGTRRGIVIGDRYFLGTKDQLRRVLALPLSKVLPYAEAHLEEVTDRDPIIKTSNVATPVMAK